VANFGEDAQAQTADYFATPWVVSPMASPGNSQSSNGADEAGAKKSPGIYADIYERTTAQDDPNAPPWTLSEHLGIDEIATDNIALAKTNRQADLSSLFSAGAIATAESSRLNGILSATGVYRRNIEDEGLDGFSGYGYANGQLVIVPGSLVLSIHGLMDDISREGNPVQNALVQVAQDTQTYSISASPFLSNRIGDIGINVLRYQIGELWVHNNTSAIQIPGLSIGPISSSIDQNVREDYKMAGTLAPRLMTDVSLSGMENDNGTGEEGSGDFTRATGEAINEYEMTRFASAIFGGGYERLHDSEFRDVDGEGPVWDVGTRWKPNANSYFLLTYGRHDLRNDFAGEMSWRLTDLSSVYAAYTDSITNSQQSIIGSNGASQLGPDGAASGVTVDQSTLIGTLDDPTLNAGPGEDSGGSPLGTPLTDANAYMPLQNGLFRVKALSATARSQAGINSFSLTAYRSESTQLTGVGAFSTLVGQVELTRGIIFSWQRPLSADLSGYSSLGYSHSELGGSELYSASLGLTKTLTDSLSAVARYDFFYHNAHPSTIGYVQSAVTIGLHKTFN
jgi:uncharacterized protein (PEP-CTERM system associated)